MISLMAMSRSAQYVLRKGGSLFGFDDSITHKIAIRRSEKLDTAYVGLLGCWPAGVKGAW